MARSVAADPSTAARTVAVRRALATPRAVAVQLFVGALGLRLALATQIVFPPLGDAAYYLAIARSLYAGHGLTVGIIWNYQPPPHTVVGPSNDYWGPLASVAEWLSLLVFGNHLYAALLPGALAGALLVALTYSCGRPVFAAWLQARGVTPLEAAPIAHRLALGAALLLAVNAELTYQSVMGDSGMLYGLVAFGAIVLCERALQPAPEAGAFWDRTWGWPGASAAAWAAGLLVGAAYLTRGSAVFLAPALGGWWLWWLWRVRSRPGADAPVERARLVGAGAALVAGAAIVVVPWLVRQQLVFGHAFSPEASNNALAFSIAEFADYGTSPTLATLWQHGLAANLSLRAEAFWDELHHVTDYLFYPTSLPALAGLFVLARGQRLARLGLINLAVLGGGFALVFPAVTLFGGYYHSVASVAPFLAWGYLAGIYVVARWARARLPLHISLAPALAAIPILLQAALLALAAPALGAGAAHDRRVYAAISGWLHAHGARVVMTDESSTVDYASGIPAIQLPSAQSLAVAHACARRYGAQYLVLTSGVDSYPQIQASGSSRYFTLVAATADYLVYRVEP